MNANINHTAHAPRVIAIALSLAIVAGVGCGEENNPKTGGGPLAPGVAADRAVTSLSESERTAFCQGRDKAVKEAIEPVATPETTCRLAGVFAVAVTYALSPNASDADLQMACMQAYDKCKKDPGEDPEGTPKPTTCKPAPAGCTATVGETEACIYESIAETKKIFSDLPQCSSITKASIKPDQPTQVGPACKVMEMKCPGWKL